MSDDRIRHLWRSAQVSLRDARAPAEHLSAQRRLGAAYDAGLACALLVLACNRVEVSSAGDHRAALEYLVKKLGVNARVSAAVPVILRMRGSCRFGEVPVLTEADVAEAVSWAQALIDGTWRWLREHHPSAAD